MPLHPDLTQNLRHPHGFVPLRIEGQLPEGLAGTLFRAGTGLYERFGERVPHPFQADGAMSALRLDGAGQAEGAARIIESAGYKEEEAAGRYLYSSNASWPRKLVNGVLRRGKNTANTSAWSWQGRLFGLMEGAKPTELDPASLDTVGATDLGVVTHAFSAHPHRVASLESSFNFGSRFDKELSLHLYALPDRGPAKLLSAVTAPWLALVHDFAVTRSHALFVICPARMKILKALFRVGGFADWFDWEPARGTELIAVSLTEPDKVYRITMETYWVWHFANAYEPEPGQLVVDLARYPDLGTLWELGGGPIAAPPILHRMRVDLDRRSARSEAIWDRPCEFPRVHPRVEGGTHRYVWVRAEGASGEARHAISRVDTETGESATWEAEAHESVGEPVIAPTGEGELQGWVLSLVYDAKKRESGVVLLRADAPEDGPVARAWFSQPIPESFHGCWVPE